MAKLSEAMIRALVTYARGEGTAPLARTREALESRGLITVTRGVSGQSPMVVTLTDAGSQVVKPHLPCPYPPILSDGTVSKCDATAGHVHMCAIGHPEEGFVLETGMQWETPAEDAPTVAEYLGFREPMVHDMDAEIHAAAVEAQEWSDAEREEDQVRAVAHVEHGSVSWSAQCEHGSSSAGHMSRGDAVTAARSHSDGPVKFRARNGKRKVFVQRHRSHRRGW